MSKIKFEYSKSSNITLEQARVSRLVVWATLAVPVLLVVGGYILGLVTFGLVPMLIGTAIVLFVVGFFALIIYFEAIWDFFSDHFRRYKRAKRYGVKDE